MKLKKYVHKHLKTELDIIRQNDMDNIYPMLTIEEKTITYKYTIDGFFVNEMLRESRGKKASEFAKHLTNVLSKLPPFIGITFRGTNLTSTQISNFEEAYASNTNITEYGFLSTSRVKKQADKYRTSVMFEIYSKNGKLIEKLSKFVNKQEVLFQRNTTFKVLGIEKRDSYVYITLKEI